MKYKKEKIKKFAAGGKTVQEIMAEARRNQAIERQAQTRDMVSNAGIPAYQSSPVTINAPRPTVELKEYAKPKTFGEAFAEARRAGLKEFTYNGKPYAVKLASEVPTGNTTPAAAIAPDTGIPQSSTTPTPTTRTDTTYVGRELPTLYVDAQRVSKAPVRTTSFWQRLKKWPGYSMGLVTPQEMYGYKKGGKAPEEKNKTQEAIPVRTFVQRILRIEPEYQPVNPKESVTEYIDDPLIGPTKRISVIKKSVPYGNGYLRSTRTIKKPGTAEADTTYLTPSGKSFNNQDIIKKYPNLGSYRDKFSRYFKYQKGGKTSKVPDELYIDFVVRYLKAIGITEDEMVNQSGAIKEEYIDEASTALQEVDFPEFWEEYKTDPDRMVTSYIETRKSPEEVELAKKGAKLKELKSKKKRKCKCGCDLVLKKDTGGALVEVCACGCKK